MNAAFKTALDAEVLRIEALIFSIQRKMVDLPAESDLWVYVVLEHRLYAAMGRREGVLKAIDLLGTHAKETN